MANIKDFVKQSRIIEILLSFRQRLKEKKANQEYGYPLDYHVYDQSYTEEYQNAWTTTQKLILETKYEVEKSGAKYLLVSFPGSEAVDKNKLDAIYKTYPLMENSKIDIEKPDKLLSALCKNEKINCLYMLPYLKNFLSQNPNTSIYNWFDGHWNQTGTNLAADFLFQYLKYYFAIK